MLNFGQNTNKRAMMYLPKRYWSSIADFYKDRDGWWIRLKSDGNYILRGYSFKGYASEYAIHEDTQKAAIAAFKQHVTEKEN